MFPLSGVARGVRHYFLVYAALAHAVRREWKRPYDVLSTTTTNVWWVVYLSRFQFVVDGLRVDAVVGYIIGGGDRVVYVSELEPCTKY